jgi:predicted nucleotidyltransferase
MIAAKQIENLATTLVDLTHPLKVILFGSYANGNANEDSDVDVLVIVDQSDISRIERVKKIRKQLWNYSFDFPKDILIYTQAEVEEWQAVPQAFITTAINEGKVLYENKK